MDAALTFVIELLFGLLFVSALVGYALRRDPLYRDVALVFSGLTVLFVIELARRTIGEPPAVLGSIGIALFLAQPYFTLRLVQRIRPVHPAIHVAALVGFALTALPLVVLGDSAPVALTLAAVAVFVVVEVMAAVEFLREARRRSGSARVRLVAAGVATVLFAGAILAAGAGTGAESDQAAVVGTTARVVALLAALAYLVAFLPPRWLRGLWQATATYDFSERLFRAEAVAEKPAELWQELVSAAEEMTGEQAAVVSLPARRPPEVAWSGARGVRPSPPLTPDDLVLDATDLDLFAAPAGLPIPDFVRRFAEEVDARYITVIPIASTVAPGSLLVGAKHRSLFRADDRELLAALARRAAVLADRREMVREQQSLAEQLASTVDALRSASKAKSDFLASMSHELRTPLSAIIGFSDLMRGEPMRDDRFAVPVEWVEHINRSGQHLLTLINDVLDLSRIEAGRLELRIEQFPVGPLVEETMAGLRPLADRKRLVVEAEIDPRIVLHADRGRFRQILYNLLANAIKFTPEGGSVTVSAEAVADVIRVDIVDTGVGIAEDDQFRVFEEFQQVGDRAVREAGTGLGLALTRRLVQAHGGRVELESRLGAGSRFSVYLPAAGAPRLRDGEHAPGVVPGAAQGPAEPRAESRREAADILVVEDDPSAVRLLRTYLESDGYSVRAADTGESALAEARRIRPSGILLDVLLPGMDGWEVLRQLKADDQLRDVPVIIVTVVDEREVGLALGAVDYFLKPVDRDALLTRLARYTFTAKVREANVRVLAVDDDPAALDMVGAILEGEGFEVLSARGGQEALDVASRAPLDLVICDLVMPGVDGFEVVQRLKSNASTSRTPILILTAHQVSEAEKERLNGRILGIIDKGERAQAGLREWLARVAPVTGDPGARNEAAEAGPREER